MHNKISEQKIRKGTEKYAKRQY